MIRVSKVRARTLGVLTAAGLAATVLPASPAAAVACTVQGVSPNYVIVGLSPVTRTYTVETGTCTSAASWTLSAPAANLTVTSTTGAATSAIIDPMGLANADAGTEASTVSVVSADPDAAASSAPGPFTLKRRSTWSSGTVNASPEPVTKGKNITIRGQLVLANWASGSYVGYAGRSVRVEFRAKGTSTYRYVKSATTSGTGWIGTTTKASRDGYWRLRYAGNSVAGGATSAGDYVNVR